MKLGNQHSVGGLKLDHLPLGRAETLEQLYTYKDQRPFDFKLYRMILRLEDLGGYISGPRYTKESIQLTSKIVIEMINRFKGDTRVIVDQAAQELKSRNYKKGDQYLKEYLTKKGKIDFKYIFTLLEVRRYLKQDLEFDKFIRLISTLDNQKEKVILKRQYARIFENKKQYKKALNFQLEYLKYYPNSAWVYNDVGNTYNSLGDYEKADLYFNKALGVYPNFGIAIHNITFNLHTPVKKAYYASDLVSLLHFSEIAVKKINSVAPYSYIGSYYRAKGKDKQAQEYFEKSLKGVPKGDHFHYSLDGLNTYLKKRTRDNKEQARYWRDIQSEIESPSIKIAISSILLKLLTKQEREQGKLLTMKLAVVEQFMKSISAKKEVDDLALNYAYALFEYEYSRITNDAKQAQQVVKIVKRLKNYYGGSVQKKFYKKVQLNLNEIKNGTNKGNNTSFNNSSVPSFELEENLELIIVFFVIIIVSVFSVKYSRKQKINGEDPGPKQTTPHINKNPRKRKLIVQSERPKNFYKDNLPRLIIYPVLAYSIFYVYQEYIINGNPDFFEQTLTSSSNKKKRVRTSQKGRKTLPNWPPVLYETYPNLQLVDHQGKELKLSKFKGEIVILELIGMTCRGCHAFSGGNQLEDKLNGISPQKNLESFKKYYKQFSGLDLFQGQVKFVQLLIYNLENNQTKWQDAEKWAKHFYPKGLPSNVTIAVPKQSMISPQVYKVIPRFHLIGRDQETLSLGKDLYYELIPSIPKLLN